MSAMFRSFIAGQLATLETLETFTLLGAVYLALVWGLSAVIREVESRLALPEERPCKHVQDGRQHDRGGQARGLPQCPKGIADVVDHDG